MPGGLTLDFAMHLVANVFWSRMLFDVWEMFTNYIAPCGFSFTIATVMMLLHDRCSRTIKSLSWRRLFSRLTAAVKRWDDHLRHLLTLSNDVISWPRPLRPMSHLRFYRASLPRNFFARQHRKCDMPCRTLQLCRINKNWPITVHRIFATKFHMQNGALL